MTWNDFYRRQHAIRTVLDRARHDPAAPLDPQLVPGVFTDRDELLRALHHKWAQSLTGRIDVGLEEADQDPHGDRVEAVSKAWRRTAQDNPVLRQVLDAHAEEPAVEDAVQREQRMLAVSAGLAEPHEPVAELNRVGQAFLSLLRATREHAPNRRRSPLSQLRKLIPSF